VLVRNGLDLEESRFVAALVAFSVLGAALSAAVAGGARLGRRASLLAGLTAFALVPLLCVVTTVC